MRNNTLVFNRVLGLKFLYDNFPNFFNKNRINFFFLHSKKEILELEIKNENYNTIVLKRSGNNKRGFLSDIKCKDNRFFKNITELKLGLNEFNDEFDFCVECHKFKKNENYYSDRLVVVQFSTETLTDDCDRINFIPSYKPCVSTRDNLPYIILEFPYNSENIFHVVKLNEILVKENNFSYYDISYLTTQIHKMINSIRELLIELNYYNSFQLIIRIDSYLNLLPIDFRTPKAWAKI